MLALILAITSQYIFKINTTFYFLNIISVFILLFIVLQFPVTNTVFLKKFNQHSDKQIPYSYCLNTVTVVNVVASSYFLHLLQHGHIESNPEPRNKQTNKNL